MQDEIKPYSLYAFFLTFAGATDLPNRLENELRELVGAEDANALLSNLGGLSSPAGEPGTADRSGQSGARGDEPRRLTWKPTAIAA